MNKKPKYIVASAMGSFIAPLAMVAWFFFTYSFENPDGTPDNAPIRSIPAVFMLSILVFLFQLAAYSALGNSIHEQKSPSIKLGAVYATALSTPIAVVFYFLAKVLVQSERQSTLLAITSALQFFAFLWVSFITGAFVQLWLVKKYNRSTKYTSSESDT